jgi:hypothetical protein
MSVARLFSVECYNRWIMNWKKVERKGLRPNRGTIPEFAWGYRRKPPNPVRITGIFIKIRTKHLINTTLVFHRYTKLLDLLSLVPRHCGTIPNYLLYFFYLSLYSALDLGRFFSFLILYKLSATADQCRRGRRMRGPLGSRNIPLRRKGQ